MSNAAQSGLSEQNPIVRGDWKFWLAEDGAVCIETPDGDGTALSWNTFDTIFTRLAALRRRSS